MERAGLHHLVELPTEPCQLFVDGAAVGLDLGLAGAADKAEPTPLPLEVRPGAHQSRPLIAERCHLDLEHAFARGGAVGEDLEDQSRPVEELHLPFAFEVPLLHRRHRPVDEHQFDLVGRDALAQFGHLAGPEELPRLRLREPHDLGADDLQPRQRGGKRHGLVQRKARLATVGVGGDFGMKNQRAGIARGGVIHVYSSPS